MTARQGTEEPEQLTYGDIYTCINGGKDRKRVFSKPLKNPNMKKGHDRNRTLTRNMMVHVTESSWRARRKRTNGHAKLTQTIYFLGNAATFANIPHRPFTTITGSTRSDVCGPINLDSLIDLPTMPAARKKDYYGKRFILAGGRVTDGTDDDDDDDSEDGDGGEVQNLGDRPIDGKEEDPPIAHHCLPVELITNLTEGFNVKHVIDISPTPLPLAYQIIKKGGSYVAVCATEVMNSYLKEQLFNQLIKGVVDPDEKLLYDPRFSAEAAEAGCHGLQLYVGHAPPLWDAIYT